MIKHTKKILSIFLAAVLAAGVLASSQQAAEAAGNTVMAGSVKNISKKDFRFRGKYSKTMNKVYKGKYVWAMCYRTYRTNSSKYLVTSRGITFGASVKAVRSKYGKGGFRGGYKSKVNLSQWPYNQLKDKTGRKIIKNRTCVSYYWNEGRRFWTLDFIFKNNRLVSVWTYNVPN